MYKSTIFLLSLNKASINIQALLNHGTPCVLRVNLFCGFVAISNSHIITTLNNPASDNNPRVSEVSNVKMPCNFLVCASPALFCSSCPSNYASER